MKKIETEITINAAPKSVWKVLTNFKDYSKWNPFIKSIFGEQKVGKQIEVCMQPPNGKEMTFKPDILKFSENKEFRWVGKLVVKGIFDGEHYFKLVDLGGDQTKLIHGENFGGILLPLMGKILSNTKLGFQLMNESLKKECETFVA